MSTSTPVAAGSVQKLAELIYVELVGRAFLRSETSITFKPNPEQLAKLSLQLAETFHKAEKDRIAEMGPKNVGYDIQSADLGTWQK